MRHGEVGVAFVLPHTLFVPRNLLVGGRHDEVGMVHGQQIGGELHAEVVLVLEFLPVDVSVLVLGFFQRMGDVALGHIHAVTHQCGHKVAIAVVACENTGHAVQKTCMSKTHGSEQNLNFQY